MSFSYKRQIHFYETDAMAIVHHGVYVLLMEEARVEWLRQHGILAKMPLSQVNYPVLSLQVDYRKSITFEDEVEIEVKATLDKIRMSFDYTLKTQRFSEPVAFGKTVHVAMDMETRKPIRIPPAIAALAALS
jgi:acyl-CoA thioester hydrolase